MIKCGFAWNSINYKNNKIVACPRGQGKLSTELLPSKIYNSKDFISLRKQLANDIWPKHCRSCEDFEKFESSEPYRLHKQIYVDSEEIDSGYVNNDKLKYIEFRFSTACNFLCLHCSNQYSSQWQKLVTSYEPDELDDKHKLEQFIHKNKGQNFSLDNSTCIDIFEDLCKHFPNIETIAIAGGEPLYQKQFWLFLEQIQNHPNIKNMTLLMYSNFNFKCDYLKLAEMIKCFKFVDFRISVEASKKIYPYFRSGKWESLERNLSEFHKAKMNNVKITAVCTWGVYQMLDAFNVINDMKKLDVDRITSAIIQYPNYLNPCILRFKFDHFVQDQLLMLKETYGQESAVKNIITYYNQHKSELKHYLAFLEYVFKTNKLMNKDFNDYYDKIKYDYSKKELIYV